jgi:pilus assembly protein CpaC
VGDLPVLGALFRSSRWKRNESELMIIVTPRLATAEDRAYPKLDAIPGKEPTAKELQLFGKALDHEIRPSDPIPPTIGAPAKK